MCQDCGCSVVGEIGISSHTHEPEEHHHHHHHHHSHNGNGKPQVNRTLEITQSILSKNDRLAERNRGYFLAKGLLVLNVLSSPGSGKTALIQRTITDLKERLKTGVIVGDLETDNDAVRLRNSGAPAVQITTAQSVT